MENAKLIDNKNCDNMAVILIFIGKGKIGAKSAWWKDNVLFQYS